MDIPNYVHPQTLSNRRISIDGAGFIAAMLPLGLLLFLIDMAENQIILHLFVFHWLLGARWVPAHIANCG